jgi:hypothetical protein
MPFGVRKPPKHEPAGLRRGSMGISAFARALWQQRRVGDGADGDAASETWRPTVGGVGACRSRCSGLQSRSWRKARGWRSPEQRALRFGVSVCRAGSRRRPGCCGSAGGARGCIQRSKVSMMRIAPAAARARRAPIERFCRFDSLRLGWRRRHGTQFAGARNIEFAHGAGEQAVVADAVEAMWQDMEQEAPNELVRRERHDALPLRAVTAVVFVAEGDAGLVVGDQTLIGDGDAMRVARQIGEHTIGTVERRLGVDHPSLLPERREMAQEAARVGKIGLGAEEGELAGFVQRDQSGEEQAAEERAQDPHRQEEGGTR